MEEFWRVLVSINYYSILESGFVISLLGAMAGATAGALAAHGIASRDFERNFLIEQIRFSNVAIMFSFSLCNSFIRLKDQSVSGLYRKYSEDREMMNSDHQGNRSLNGRGAGESYFSADLTLLEMPAVPIEYLADYVFRRISLNGRPLAALSDLMESLGSLSSAISQRNEFISDIVSSEKKDSEDFPSIYFGLPYGRGHVSTLYPDLMDKILHNTNHCIFFSKKLCEDLMEYAIEAREACRKLDKSIQVDVNSPNFSEAHEKGLMPDDHDYVGWLQAFGGIKRNSKPRKRYWETLGFFRKKA